MSLFKFLISKLFLKHLGIAFGILVFLLITTFITLSIYTYHGESFSVPDFYSLTEDQLQDLITNNDLKYKIIDSVHITNFTPGAVVEQTPKAGALVKKNRTIFFTINAITPEKIQMPKLNDYSLRNARVTLESYGLRTGELIYIPSEYTNLVLGQHLNGKPIAPGTPVLKGTAIDLLVGKGLSNKRTNIPDLFTLTLTQAKEKCQNLSLNVGATIYDSTVVSVEDSLSAFIYNQNPRSTSNSKLRLGSSLDIWLTKDSSRILPDTTAINEIDTTFFSNTAQDITIQ